MLGRVVCRGLRGVGGECFGGEGEREGAEFCVEADQSQAVIQEVASVFLAGADDAF